MRGSGAPLRTHRLLLRNCVCLSILPPGGIVGVARRPAHALDTQGRGCRRICLLTLAILTTSTRLLVAPPPFAISLFFLKGAVPGALSLKDTYLGVIPFVAIQLLALALVMTIPMLSLWLPMRLGYFD